MSKKFYVYFYYDKEGTLLYIGKALDVWVRWTSHNESWKKDVCKIGILECPDHAAMNILEDYFIAKIPSIYNKAGLAHGYTRLEFPNLKVPEPFTLEEFRAKYKPKTANIITTALSLDDRIREIGNSIVEIDGIIDLYDNEFLKMDLDRVVFKYGNLYLGSRFSKVPGDYITQKEKMLSYRTNDCILAVREFMYNPTLIVQKEKELLHATASITASETDTKEFLIKVHSGFRGLYRLYERYTTYRGNDCLRELGTIYNGLQEVSFMKGNEGTHTCLLAFNAEQWKTTQPVISATTFSYDVERMYHEILQKKL